ncbi:MAG: alpha/beta-hydrolase family protein [Mycobacterium leprae]
MTGRRAHDPIRVFAGTSSASDVEARAELAVNDLVRAGGFARRTLLVVTTTGSGWVDPASVDTFEYLTGGDSATIAMQYSYLPSWISYLVDQNEARQAGRELFDAVYERWSNLPADRRPKLYVFGESLGSFGGETAFSGEHDLRNRTSGALFAGPPHFNALYRSFTDQRDAGSREVQAVYKRGRTVRFDNDPGGRFAPTSAPWRGSRVVYLVNPSDPIVWWDTHLILHRPDWLRESRGNDVVPAMTWIPFVSFCQVTADLPFATGVPTGHGHTYSNEYVAAWRSILRPTTWSTQQYARLQAIAGAE